MPTENRRVATYLPKELDDRLKAFITERNLKGDSPALITILSEFFDVSYSVAHQVDYSGFVKAEQFDDLVSKVSELSKSFEKSKESGATNLLLGKLQRLESRIESLENVTSPSQMDLLKFADSSLPSNLPGELPRVEQSSSPFKLLRELVNKTEDKLQIVGDSNSQSNSLGELKQVQDISSTLEPLTGTELALRFGVHEKLPTNKRNLLKSEQGFAEWTREQDPEGIGWRYDSEAKGRKKYFPLLDGETSSQVSPLPEGSERSGEG
jgi:hypothetical protein